LPSTPESSRGPAADPAQPSADPAPSAPVPLLARIENWVSFILLCLAVLLSFGGVVTRAFSSAGLRSSGGYIQHIVIWIAFAGGALASRERKHLALTYGLDLLPPRAKAWVQTATSAVDGFILAILTLASLQFALRAFDPGSLVGVIPTRVLALAMPAGFLLMTVRAIAFSSKRPARRLVALAGLVLGLAYALPTIADLLSALPRSLGGLGDAVSAAADAVAPVVTAVHLPLVVVLVAAGLLGSPIFVLLGGLAVLLFTYTGGTPALVPNEAYTMLSGPMIPALPLFTLAGFILSESRAGERLVRLFRALFGWLPGGLAIMGILICAFLTTFTGASGVTILAVGALLYYIFTTGGYGKDFSTGMLTASGSIGLLFPPSLPVILYGVVGQVNIKEMFVGGIMPGIFMVLALAAMGVVASVRQKVPRTRFSLREVGPALLYSILEILLPFLVLLFFLKGWMTLVETAAFSVLWAFLVEVVIYRDIKWRDLPQVFLKAAVIMGGVLTILAVAKGLSYYIVDAEFPTRLVAWMQEVVKSKFIFLILLNLALLVVGCFMDIFSAITVVVPLIVPLGLAYGVHPVHLGIIFLANLELGYLTPPVGINLFLASYRFNQPLAHIYRVVIPFLLVLLAAVLVITYVPWMTTGLLKVVKL
jgi:tripartite ATP-independent transporter DctM subunit